MDAFQKENSGQIRGQKFQTCEMLSKYLFSKLNLGIKKREIG
jgi:hypothetical protein